MKLVFQNLGWESKVSQKRATSSISINRLVAIGCGLRKGEKLYSYLANDEEGRPVMVTYLDGKERKTTCPWFVKEVDTPLLCEVIE